MRWRDDGLIVLASLLPLALFLVGEHRIAGAAGFPLDDSWIHLQFARNIAEGRGFAFNPGVPVAGSTAPLWTLLLAGGVAIAGSSVMVVKAIGIGTAMAAALVTRRAAVAWGAWPMAGLVAAVALLWTPAMAWGELSGMEVGLAALLVAATLWALARERATLSVVFAALAVLARPEAAVLLLLVLFARPLTIGRIVVFTIVTAVVLAPAVTFSMLTVGAPLPATAVAKVKGGLVGWLEGGREPVMYALVTRPLEFGLDWVRWLVSTHWLLPLALLPGVFLAWWRGGRALGVPALALVLHPLAMALLAPYRGPGFQEGRYSIHLLPLALVVLAVGLGSGRTRPRRGALAVYLALALVTLVPAASRYAWQVQNINAMQVHLGHWVDEHLPKTARLALNDIGAIAYISRRQVIDLMGLVTPEIIPYRRTGDPGVMRYLAIACPDYVIVFPNWFPAMVARADLLQPIYRVRLAHNVVAGGAEMVVYRLVRCTV